MVIDFGCIVCLTGWCPILQHIISKKQPQLILQQTIPLFYQAVSFYEVQYGIVAPMVLWPPLYFFCYKSGSFDSRSFYIGCHISESKTARSWILGLFDTLWPKRAKLYWKVWIPNKINHSISYQVAYWKEMDNIALGILHWSMMWTSRILSSNHS